MRRAEFLGEGGFHLGQGSCWEAEEFRGEPHTQASLALGGPGGEGARTHLLPLLSPPSLLVPVLLGFPLCRRSKAAAGACLGVEGGAPPRGPSAPPAPAFPFRRGGYQSCGLVNLFCLSVLSPYFPLSTMCLLSDC